MRTHILEPWRNTYGDLIVDRFGAVMAMFQGHALTDAENEANAKRAVACVNALAGVDDPAAVPELLARAAVSLARAIDCLEYVTKCAPEFSGWGVRQQRTEEFATLLAEIKNTIGVKS